MQPIPCPEGGDDPVLCLTCRRRPDDPSHVFPADYLQPWEGPYGRSATDDREARDHGHRGGTRLGPLPAMPTRARIRRVAAVRDAKSSARALNSLPSVHDGEETGPSLSQQTWPGSGAQRARGPGAGPRS